MPLRPETLMVEGYGVPLPEDGMVIPAELVNATVPSGWMEMVSCWESEPVALVAVISTGKVPAKVGVPEIKPLVVFRVKPAGKGSLLNEVAGWVVVIWWEKGSPTVPVAVSGLVIPKALAMEMVSCWEAEPCALVAVI